MKYLIWTIKITIEREYEPNCLVKRIGRICKSIFKQLIIITNLKDNV